MNNNGNTIQINGKTLYRVVYNGVNYGFMRPKAYREFFARHAAK